MLIATLMAPRGVARLLRRDPAATRALTMRSIFASDARMVRCCAVRSRRARNTALSATCWPPSAHSARKTSEKPPWVSDMLCDMEGGGCSGQCTPAPLCGANVARAHAGLAARARRVLDPLPRSKRGSPRPTSPSFLMSRYCCRSGCWYQRLWWWAWRCSGCPGVAKRRLCALRLVAPGVRQRAKLRASQRCKRHVQSYRTISSSFVWPPPPQQLSRARSTSIATAAPPPVSFTSSWHVF